MRIAKIDTNIRSLHWGVLNAKKIQVETSVGDILAIDTQREGLVIAALTGERLLIEIINENTIRLIIKRSDKEYA